MEFVGQADSRGAYHDRVHLLSSRPRLPNTSVIVSPDSHDHRLNSHLPPCNRSGALSRHYCRGTIPHAEVTRLRLEADFSLMLRGDEPSSDRLQNALAALQVVLIVGEANVGWLPFGHAVPWRRIVRVVPQAAFDRAPTRAVMQVVRDAARGGTLFELRQRIHSHLPDLLFGVQGSRIAENFVREAALAADCPASWRPPSRLGSKPAHG